VANERPQSSRCNQLPSASAAGCTPTTADGVHVTCTYQQIGEIYATGQTDPITRQLERDIEALTAVNPITGKMDKIAQAMADHTEQRFLHMITSDPNRTPNFVVFLRA
jgi:hypothetical protein